MINHQIKIDVVRIEPLESFLDSVRNSVMIIILQLCGEEEAAPVNSFQAPADGILVVVHASSIYVPVREKHFKMA